jgi:TorA maturation chaperone TorD
MAPEMERAELYLCLARSFLAPADDGTFAALRDTLAQDLEELCGVLGVRAERAIEDYRRTMAAIRTADELRLVHSTLFAAPPRLAHLNSSAYLDGTVMGASLSAMEQCYRRCGVERSEEFRNPSDHVSVQLEFVAYLYASGLREVAPEHFLDAFVNHWLPGFLADLGEASPRVRANPYSALARVLSVAVERDAVPMPKDAREERKQNALVRARRKRAAQGITAEDMQEIERRLKAHGLSTEPLYSPA